MWYLVNMTLAAKETPDPVLEALSLAPVVERLTEEQRAELAQDLADIAADPTRLVRHADVPRALEQLAGSRE